VRPRVAEALDRRADDHLCGVTTSDDELISGEDWPTFADAVLTAHASMAMPRPSHGGCTTKSVSGIFSP